MVYAQIQDKGSEAKVDACFRFYDTVGPKGSGLSDSGRSILRGHGAPECSVNCAEVFNVLDAVAYARVAGFSLNSVPSLSNL